MKRKIVLFLCTLISLGLMGCKQGNNHEPIYCEEEDDVTINIPQYDDSIKYEYDFANNAIYDDEAAAILGIGEDQTISTYKQNTILFDRTTPFSYGTIEVTINESIACDAGIIFCVEDNGLDTFWEGNVAYYFYFVSKDGTAYLGKTDYGNWSELLVTAIPGYSVGTDVKLKVILKGTKILCYANDELIGGYKDKNPIMGTSYGLRAGGSGVSYTNLSITSEYKY